MLGTGVALSSLGAMAGGAGVCFVELKAYAFVEDGHLGSGPLMEYGHLGAGHGVEPGYLGTKSLAGVDLAGR